MRNEFDDREGCRDGAISWRGGILVLFLIAVAFISMTLVVRVMGEVDEPVIEHPDPASAYHFYYPQPRSFIWGDTYAR